MARKYSRLKNRLKPQVDFVRCATPAREIQIVQNKRAGQYMLNWLVDHRLVWAIPFEDVVEDSPLAAGLGPVYRLMLDGTQRAMAYQLAQEFDWKIEIPDPNGNRNGYSVAIAFVVPLEIAMRAMPFLKRVAYKQT